MIRPSKIRKNKLCPKCKTKRILSVNKTCAKCSIKRGKDNPRYIDGRTNNTKCKNCGVILINHSAKTQLCRKCWLKSRIGYKHSTKTIKRMIASWKKRKKYIIKICKFCKKFFTIVPHKNFRKYCSIKCANKNKIGVKLPFRIWNNNYNPNWKGGIAKLPYPYRFTTKLKEKIRLKYGNNCALCGLIQTYYLKKYHRKLDIHHIDYNKENCKEDNLIALCIGCHMKTNSNRDYWFAYFTYLMGYKC